MKSSAALLLQGDATLREKCLDKLCSIAGGMATAVAIGVGTRGIALGAAAAVFAGGALLSCISENRRGDFDKALQKIKKRVEQDHPTWLSGDARTHHGSKNQIIVAMAAFENVMEKLVITPQTFTAADMNGARLAVDLLKVVEPLAMEDYDSSKISCDFNRQVFSIIIENTFALVSVETVFRDNVATAVSAETLARLRQIENKIDQLATRDDLEAMFQKFARDEGIDPDDLRPIFEHLGQMNLSKAEIKAKLKEAIAAILVQANRKQEATNQGEDIDTTIVAARAALKKKRVRRAVSLLSDKIKDVEQDHLMRLRLLYVERLQIEQVTYDHAAARATLKSLLRLDDRDMWSWATLGDLEMRIGSLADALLAYQSGAKVAKVIRDERNDSVFLNRIGDVQVAQGDGPAALKSYTAGLVIAERLAASDPANAEWQRDLSVSYDKIGDVQVAQGDGPAAPKSHTAGLAIAERLAANDPANAGWQRDLIISYVKFCEVGFEPKKHLDKALAVASAMKARGILAAVDDWMLDDLRNRLGALDNGRGVPNPARTLRGPASPCTSG